MKYKENNTQQIVPHQMQDDLLPLLFRLTYLIVGTLALVLTRFTITTPDTFNYLLIAEQLISGEWVDAVSSHWSIGIAVLTAPLMAVGVDGILAFKIVQLIIGYFTLTLFLRIISATAVQIVPSYRRFLSVTAFLIALPLVILMSLELTSDLLLTTLLLWYFYLIVQLSIPQPLPNQVRDRLPKGEMSHALSKGKHDRMGEALSERQTERKKTYAWQCGVVAGLAYWSKAYALPFFVLHFIGWHVILLLVNGFFNKKNNSRLNDKKERYAKNDLVLRRNFLLKNMVVGTVVFALVCLPWVFMLSSKFGEPTIGMSGKYNFALISPHRQHAQLTKNELINPNTDFTEYWAYEEPALFVESWNPMTSVSDLRYYARFLMSNVVRFCYFDYARYVVLLLVLGGTGLWYARARIDWKERFFVGLTVWTALVLTSGYFLVLVRERYFWLDYFLGLILVFFFAALLVRSKQFAKRSVLIISVIFTGLLMWKSLEMIQGKTSKQAFFRQLHQHIPKLKALENKRVAANDTWGEYHHTDATVYLMYALRYDFWGQIRTQRLQREGFREATEKEMDYFILWDAEGLEQSVFQDMPLIFRDSSLRMSVYEM